MMTISKAMNPEREFEYEVSCTLRCWGDALDVNKLARDLELTTEYCRLVVKGQGVGKVGGRYKGKAKTSQLSYGCLDEFPCWKRQPYKQLAHLICALKRVDLNSYGVQSAELQISFYYKDQIDGGECEFFLDGEVIDLLSKNGICLRHTVLP